MENRTKEQQLTLFADRTSTSKMLSNQLRQYFSTFANALTTIVKELGLRGTQMATAQCEAISMRLVKVAAAMVVSTRRYRLSVSSAYPWPSLFARVLANVRAFERAPIVSALGRPPPAQGFFTRLIRGQRRRCTPYHERHHHVVIGYVRSRGTGRRGNRAARVAKRLQNGAHHRRCRTQRDQRRNLGHPITSPMPPCYRNQRIHTRGEICRLIRAATCRVRLQQNSC